MTVRLRDALQVRRRGSALFIALSCLLFGAFYLGCAGNDQKPQQSARATAKTEPTAVKTGPAPSPPSTAKADPSPPTAESIPSPPSATKAESSPPTAQPPPSPPSAEASPPRAAASPQEPVTRQAETRRAEAAVPVAKNVPPPKPAAPPQKAAAPAGGKNTAAAGAEVPSPAKTTSATPPRVGTVSASRLNVRRSPDLNAAKVSTVPRGEKLKILGEEGDWYHVAASDDAPEGWVAKRYIEMPSPVGSS